MVGDTGDSLDAPVSSDDALRAALPAVFSRARVVISPYPFVAAGGDYLRVISLNSLTGAAIEIHGRQASRGFEGLPFRFPHTPLTNRTPKTEDFPLNEGLVTNLSVQAVSGAPLIGQTFVIIQLVRSVGSVAFVLGTLLQGYVTSTQALGWPGSPIASSIEGGGYPRLIVGTTPAPGAEVLETVPAGARWRLHAFRSILQADGAGGTRTPALLAIGGGNRFMQVPQPSGTPPTFATSYHWGAGLNGILNPGGLGPATGWLNNAPLIAGQQLGTLTIGLDAGDQWTAPVFLVEEWLEAT